MAGVRTYEIRGKQVQIIHLDTPKVLSCVTQFIRATSDFGFCKNMYYVEDNMPKVEISCIQELYSMHFDFAYAYRLGSSIARAFKYIERGFTMTNNITYEEAAQTEKFNEEMVTLVVKRMTRLKASEKADLWVYVSKQQSFRSHMYSLPACDKRCPIKFFGGDVVHVHITRKECIPKLIHTLVILETIPCSS